MKIWDKARNYYIEVVGKNPKGSTVIQLGINYDYGERIVLTPKQIKLLMKELKKKRHYWCDYCKKSNTAKEVEVTCDECYYCKDCGHPKAWHDKTMNSCFANGDNCGCWGYKPDKNKGLVKEKELQP